MYGFPIVQNILNSMLIAQASMSGTTEDTTSSGWVAFLTSLAFILAIFVLPFIISHFLSKGLRMPTHSFRIGVVLATIIAALLVSYSSSTPFVPKMGPDIRGGTTLVYDIMPDEKGQIPDPGSLATALSDRINPSGTKEISIRPSGTSQIEITVPNTDELELKRIKKFLQDSGQLEFRIVANSRDHLDIIDLAEKQATASKVAQPDVYSADGSRVVGRWFRVGREAKKIDGILPLKTPVLGDIIRDSYTGEIIDSTDVRIDTSENYALERFMDREGIREVDVLMAYESIGKPYAVVNGDDLASATTEFGKAGYEVSFRLNTAGANRMLYLTSVNGPDGQFHRRMAIIMDEKVLSAPQLNSPISSSGVITGNFSKEEVDFLVTILRSGRLPATLSEEPASEDRVGAGLGATTITKGATASVWAVAATFICILLYYRFSGVVAAMALLVNGLLILGIMIFIGQPITLAGMAGLVLTVGMSVDANVLIFERIREEKAKGSAPRMSIRNGFDRAFTTIIDANLTTLIAAIVLYWIGTDQVRGFAVALVIGIITSMFTATFCSRIVFEIAEKLKMVSLSMSDGVGFLKKTFLGSGDINFMGWQKACFVLSVLMITAGIVAVGIRRDGLLNIDFLGGTKVTFQLNEAVEVEELRGVLKKILDEDQDGQPVQFTLVNVEKEPADTIYTMVCSIESEEYLASELAEGFPKESSTTLKTYTVKILDTEPVTTGSLFRSKSRVRLVSYQPQENSDTPAETQATEESEAAANPDNNAAANGPAADVATEGNTVDEEIATAVPADIEFTEVLLKFGGSTDADGDDSVDSGAKIDADTLKENIAAAAQAANVTLNANAIEVLPMVKDEDTGELSMPTDWLPDDIAGFSTWQAKVPASAADTDTIVSQLQTDLAKQPLWLSLSRIGSRVAGEMQQRAIAAILLSLIFIVAYIWFRFQKVAYGLAAVVALVHDVLITLGVLALCHWLSGPIGQIFLIEDFKIGLTEVAAFLTIIGYSLNDTIVVFDRIREVRGRSPKLTAKMINDSVNQTLSRTLLTSGTTLITVILLYVFGGEGIHAFAFALLIGVLVGTYSSIFVAAPVLLWISNRDADKNRGKAATAA